jgi:hypothetical protein
VAKPQDTWKYYKCTPQASKSEPAHQVIPMAGRALRENACGEFNSGLRDLPYTLECQFLEEGRDSRAEVD